MSDLIERLKRLEGVLLDQCNGNEGHPSYYSAEVVHRAAEQIESLQREKEDLQSLADTAGMDAERAITRADKAELDLKCLQESTVDAKAYQALQRTNEELKRENGELRRPVIERCPPDLDPDENCPVCLAKPGGICRQGFPGAAITPEMRERIEATVNLWDLCQGDMNADLARDFAPCAMDVLRDLLGEQE